MYYQLFFSLIIFAAPLAAMGGKWQIEQLEALKQQVLHHPSAERQDFKNQLLRDFIVLSQPYSNLNKYLFIEWLLKHGANRNQTLAEEPQLSLLEYLVEHKKIDLIRLFLQYKNTDLTLRDSQGNTALRIAAKRGYPEILLLLLEKGADSDAQNVSGNTPLHAAVYEGHANIVKLLLDHKADINKQNNRGDTPLYVAVFGQREEIAKILLDAGADPNMQNNSGYTPLHRAAQRGYIGIIKLLLPVTANPALKSNAGFTPLHLAVRDENEEAVKFLVQAKVNPNIQDASGDTPLREAVRRGGDGIVRWLLIYGADPLLQNNKGENVFDAIIDQLDNAAEYSKRIEDWPEYRKKLVKMLPLLLNHVKRSSKYLFLSLKNPQSTFAGLTEKQKAAMKQVLENNILAQLIGEETYKRVRFYLTPEEELSWLATHKPVPVIGIALQETSGLPTKYGQQISVEPQEMLIRPSSSSKAPSAPSLRPSPPPSSGQGPSTPPSAGGYEKLFEQPAVDPLKPKVPLPDGEADTHLAGAGAVAAVVPRAVGQQFNKQAMVAVGAALAAGGYGIYKYLSTSVPTINDKDELEEQLITALANYNYDYAYRLAQHNPQTLQALRADQQAKDNLVLHIHKAEDAIINDTVQLSMTWASLTGPSASTQLQNLINLARLIDSN